MASLPTDYQLLRKYLDEGSEAAFSELVARHTGLVYAAALRQVREAHAAQDVAQVVFLTLARRGGTIGPGVPLSGWLLTCTRFVALSLKRSEARRSRHERRAIEMSQNTHAADPTPSHEDPWTSVEPLLDESLDSLGQRLRAAVVLRFFEGLSFAEVAGRLGVNEPTARQRVSRGVARMRAFFARRGVRVSETGLIASITANAVPPPPPGLSALLASATHAHASAVHLAATKGVLTFMALTKAQTLAAGAIALLLLAGAGTVTWNLVHARPSEIVLDSPAPSTRADRSAALEPADATGPIPADWQSQFNAAYGLGNGQAVKLVSAPFVPARAAFWEQEQRAMGAKKVPPLLKAESLVIVWDGATPHWYSTSLDGGTLDDALWFCANLRPWDLDRSVPRSFKLPGDFAVRKGASAAQVMDGLAPIVSAKLGHPVRFEKRRVARQAIVVRGTLQYVPVDDRSTGIIDFAPHYPAQLASRSGTLDQMLSDIKNQLQIRVIDETDSGSQPVRWRCDDRWNNPTALTEYVARQTSLRITMEPRSADVWFMVAGPAAK